MQFIVFSQPRRFTMQYRGSPGWIRSREMDSPGRTLSFVLTFSEGTIHDRPTHTDNGFTIHRDLPSHVYKNRPAEISSRDGTLLFNSLGPAILGNPRKTNKLLNTPGRILGDKGHGCVTRRRLKGSRPPIRRTKRISFALFNVPRHSYARYYYERTVHLVEEKKGKKEKRRKNLERKGK